MSIAADNILVTALVFSRVAMEIHELEELVKPETQCCARQLIMNVTCRSPQPYDAFSWMTNDDNVPIDKPHNSHFSAGPQLSAFKANHMFD